MKTFIFSIAVYGEKAVPIKAETEKDAKKEFLKLISEKKANLTKDIELTVEPSFDNEEEEESEIVECSETEEDE